MHRRQPVRRQQAGDRPRSSPADGDARRPAQHPLADRRASAPRATTSRRRSRRSAGSSTCTPATRTSAPAARPSSMPCTRTIGHLGIFVSGGVAKKEHERVRQQHRLDRCAAARPLRGGDRRQAADDGTNAELMAGRLSAALRAAHARRHPRASAATTPEDERRFAAVARVSEINWACTARFVPALRAGHRSPSSGRTWLHKLHPCRLQFELLSRRRTR